MSLRTRLRKLEQKLGMVTPPNAPPPFIVTVWVAGKAPAIERELGREPGPPRWATVEGIPEIFEKGPNESESDFFSRVADRAPREKTQFAECAVITAYTCKPVL